MAEDDQQHDGGQDNHRDDDPKASDKKEAEPADQGSEDKKKEEKHDADRKASKPYVKIGLVLFLLVLVGGGFYFWLTTRGEESTDDAFTSGRTITVAPHVAGYVVELDVNDNEFVHEGQVLLRIDPRDYQATRDQAQATLDQSKGQLASSRFNVEVARQTFPGQLKQAQGQLLLAQAQQFRAETDYKRQHSIERAATSQQQVDYSTAALDQAKAQVLQAEGQLQQSSPVVPNIGTTQTRVAQQTASLAQAQAQVVQADLNLGWTVIRAPHDGWIAQRNVERGNYVQNGQSLFSIVEPDVWITANFKETQITRIRAGQSVNISVDAYPQLKLRGHVDSVQLGSGAAFSAFPPENATGNFVKIVQRVPVKVIIDSGLDPLAPLPLGISVEPTVDVK
ncbi:HlyD family secretion protein [Lichenicola cladoniae]|uniref:HlyD family secretion protein n=1 Tax=Lichenicola cladoniae TaxID=1484109 RepID=A0A6M8HMK7_9PROT|nr:HlyD family secretion protein [Lichenicola cladoniae]NPD67034.1 HlyD family secretion protein [Acetobacteraceae bacterium]QKE89578.1 HlyD family secretion protein [Lichenicola cladoniae]